MRKPKVSARRREQFLEKFERSGLSSAGFARKHGVNYTTFCGWRKRYSGRRQQRKPRFVELELPASKSVSLEVQLGGLARTQIADREQARLAALLIQELEAVSC